MESPWSALLRVNHQFAVDCKSVIDVMEEIRIRLVISLSALLFILPPLRDNELLQLREALYASSNEVEDAIGSWFMGIK